MITLRPLSRTPLSRGKTSPFAPGQSADYSDPGYFLLGMAIEKVSGLTYREFMEQLVFGPTGTTSTRMDRREIVKDHASCYALHNGVIETDRRVWQHDLPSYFGMQSTADDLVKWEPVILDRELGPGPGARRR